MTFSNECLIRFSHCDPAGIVYFVHYFDMVNEVVEDWFAQALHAPFQDLVMTRRVGFPIVNTGCEFYRPCNLGDRLVMELSLAHLGRSSIEYRIRGRVGDDQKLQAHHKVAMVSLDTMRAIPIPDDLRAKMLPYLESALGG
ncbi:MAG: acyl-CoA thioesterase [Deltaproteobacteria bacterium]|nr:acyl-CoA thioesterase [Deltaproteobacteria bacterium]